MRNRMTYRLLERLIGIDPAGLVATILILLVCALPAAAIIASIGMMHASTFLIALLLVASLIAGIFWLRMAALYWVNKHPIENMIKESRLPIISAGVELPDALACCRADASERRHVAPVVKLKRMEYAENLFNDMLSTRGPGHLFYHQGP